MLTVTEASSGSPMSVDAASSEPICRMNRVASGFAMAVVFYGLLIFAYVCLCLGSPRWKPTATHQCQQSKATSATSVLFCDLFTEESVHIARRCKTLQDVARPNLSVHFDEQYAVECRGSRFGMEKPPVRAAIEVQAVPFHYPGQINVRSQVLEDCNDTQAAFRSRFDTLDQNSEFGESNLQGRQHVGFKISYGPGIKMLLRFFLLYMTLNNLNKILQWFVVLPRVLLIILLFGYSNRP